MRASPPCNSWLGTQWTSPAMCSLTSGGCINSTAPCMLCLRHALCTPCTLQLVKLVGTALDSIMLCTVLNTIHLQLAASCTQTCACSFLSLQAPAARECCGGGAAHAAHSRRHGRRV